jgi:hypothetical protein
MRAVAAAWESGKLRKNVDAGCSTPHLFMKSRHLLLCSPLLLVAVIRSPGATTASLPSAAVYGKPDSTDDKKDSTKPPFKGMTTTQARHFYGDPDSIGHRDGEELWTYVLNAGETISKSFIPFNFNNKLRYRLLTFKDGKVVDFHWDPPPKD